MLIPIAEVVALFILGMLVGGVIYDINVNG